ncbi:head-tail joining protein [Pseudomonas sp. B392_1p]|uniref:head-tail joining protein n=1 Tax=Pseudomonas sp. B392_1p TaxID=3457507 RepID=UPI003FD55DA7
MNWRRSVEAIDEAVFAVLGDAAILDGVPVNGMFELSGDQPQLGRLNTGLAEPTLLLRTRDAGDAVRGSVVIIDLPAPDGGEYEVVDVEAPEAGMTLLKLRPTE